MTTAYVGIGSNVAPAANVRAGVAAIRETFDGVRCSTVYQTEPVGFDGPPFFNLVVAITTARDLETVIAQLRAIEDRFGRKRQRGDSSFGSRTLDLDLLLFGDTVTDDPVPLPRRDVVAYAFVLGPLTELAPETRHPALGRTFAELWAEFPAEEAAGMKAVDLKF
ncbi:2-amino-4-hydroxy-6-hydroxymethyldihydropteridine diphosphokinase [Thiohalorhabdus sp.]|uniref:2-amino-4-hydroxy-6- hydroxymethyldihydropteridine diphosphokinase n=1 Tax=Thiohalorhabdus sp. TaxID=3094134 RepID=UPI002FC30521